MVRATSWWRRSSSSHLPSHPYLAARRRSIRTASRRRLFLCAAIFGISCLLLGAAMLSCRVESSGEVAGAKPQAAVDGCGRGWLGAARRLVLGRGRVGRRCIRWWWRRGRGCCRCWGWCCFSEMSVRAAGRLVARAVSGASPRFFENSRGGDFLARIGGRGGTIRGGNRRGRCDSVAEATSPAKRF